MVKVGEDIDIETLMNISKSALMKDIYSKLKIVAEENSNVIIVGEEGTGKKLLAQIIYEQSNCEGKFQSFFCPAIHHSIFKRNFQGHLDIEEDEIKIEHEAIEKAKGGVLFLDHFAELSFENQIHIAEIVSSSQKKMKKSTGYDRGLNNFRIVLTISKSEFKKVASKNYWDYIQHHLNPVCIWLPPLRNRREDIYPIIKLLLSEYRKQKGSDPRISLRALYKCITYYWPGNIRQLENAINNALMQAQSGSIKTKDLPFSLDWDQWNRPELIATERSKSFQKAEEQLLAEIMNNSAFSYLDKNSIEMSMSGLKSKGYQLLNTA